MRIRIAALALASGLLATVVAPGVASARTGQPAGAGLVAGAGVVTLAKQTSVLTLTAASGAGIQSATYCNILVSQPYVSPSLILTGTWRVNCRNGYDPAPDIARIGMTARIYQGTPALGGTNVGARYCGTTSSPIMDCQVSTTSPIQYYIPYYSTLDVAVELTSGVVHQGSFYTTPTQLS